MDSPVSEHNIETETLGLDGKVAPTVTIRGDTSKPALITYHDIGLNHETCFESFFNLDAIKDVFNNYCVYHIDAPGQTEGAETIPEEQFPTFDEMVEQLKHIVRKYNITKFLGVGVGAGGTLLLNYGVKYPRDVSGLVLISATPCVTGWSEWVFSKAALVSLNKLGMNEFAKSQLISRYFSSETATQKPKLIEEYKARLDKMNVHNLTHFEASFLNRQNNIVPFLKSLPFRTLILTGYEGVYQDDIADTFSMFDPEYISRLEFQHCSGLLTVENPDALGLPLRFFLQGLGPLN